MQTPNVIALLTEDHKKVKKLFKEFDGLKDGNAAKRKEALVKKICDELTVHTIIEEEIVYPATRAATGDEDLMDEADVEHAGAKSLIAQLRRLKADADHYDARVTVLGEYIDHHVKEENTEMFSKMRKAKMDLVGLGARVLERKKELQRSMR